LFMLYLKTIISVFFLTFFVIYTLICQLLIFILILEEGIKL